MIVHFLSLTSLKARLRLWVNPEPDPEPQLVVQFVVCHLQTSVVFGSQAHLESW